MEFTDVIGKNPLFFQYFSERSLLSTLCFSVAPEGILLILGPSQVSEIFSTFNMPQCLDLVPLPAPTKIQLFKEHAIRI